MSDSITTTALATWQFDLPKQKRRDSYDYLLTNLLPFMSIISK